MSISTPIPDEHYLRPVLTSQRLIPVIECVNHDKCEAVRRVEENDSVAYSYSTGMSEFFEWYAGNKPSVIHSGVIHLATNDKDFVDWWYLTPYDPELAEEELLNEEHAHAVIAGVSNDDRLCWATAVCTTPHDTSYDRPELCEGEAINEFGIWDTFAQTSKQEEFQNGYIAYHTEGAYEDWECSWAYIEPKEIVSN